MIKFLKKIYAWLAPFWIIKLFPNRTAPASKRYNFILNEAKKNNIKTFVETGTYLGDTTNAVSNYFDKIYTFEITKELVDMARSRFKDKKNIEIIHGDSGVELKNILPKINEKTIFWLDGHYSEGFIHAKKYDLETPIVSEIESIFNSNIKDLKNIILVDDAFEFDGTRGYPTIEELKQIVGKYTDEYNVFVKYDIVYITPKE